MAKRTAKKEILELVLADDPTLTWEMRWQHFYEVAKEKYGDELAHCLGFCAYMAGFEEGNARGRKPAIKADYALLHRYIQLVDDDRLSGRKAVQVMAKERKVSERTLYRALDFENRSVDEIRQRVNQLKRFFEAIAVTKRSDKKD